MSWCLLLLGKLQLALNSVFFLLEHDLMHQEPQSLLIGQSLASFCESRAQGGHAEGLGARSDYCLPPLLMGSPLAPAHVNP